MRRNSPMEQSARQYLSGKIQISNINKFTKLKDAPFESYQTTKGAFMFPVSGKCEIYFDDEKFFASEGMVIHGCPEKTLRFYVVSEEPFIYINLYYNTTNQFVFQHFLEEPQMIRQTLEKLLAQSTAEGQIDVIEKNNLLSKVFDSVYQDYILPEAKNNYELVKESAAYIREHYMLDLSLDFLAKTFGKTSNQFSYLFYTYKKVRPIQYVISCRVSAACDLLSTSDLPICEVARRVGYEDALFFSRLFKKHVGCSPKQFRAACGNNYKVLMSNQDNAFVYLSANHS